MAEVGKITPSKPIITPVPRDRAVFDNKEEKQRGGGNSESDDREDAKEEEQPSGDGIDVFV